MSISEYGWARREKEHRQDLKVIAARSRRGQSIIAEHSGHHVQLEEPQLVVTAIREIAEAARK